MGHCTTAGVAPRRARMEATPASKSAPVRSILLMKQRRGTRYLSAWRQTVSDWASTPSLASNRATIPSSTRRDRSTSAVKSTCPGVSIRVMVLSFQGKLTAAE